MEDCPNIELNLEYCNCSYPHCDRKGRCCECVRYHRSRDELPGCFFTDEVERTYDRSVQRFLRMRKG